MVTFLVGQIIFAWIDVQEQVLYDFCGVLFHCYRSIPMAGVPDLELLFSNGLSLVLLQI